MTARLHSANHLQKTMSSIFIYSMPRKIGYETIWRTLYIYNSCFYIKLTQVNPKTISKWTKNTDIFSKKYLVIPICRGHHWTLVIVRTHPHISLMILDSLNKEHRSVELKITRYLQDVWSAKLPPWRLRSGQNVSFSEPHSTGVHAYASPLFPSIMWHFCVTCCH